MALIVERPGLCTTVQDRGRVGYRSFGVPVGGAFDRGSLDLANALVGLGEIQRRRSLLADAIHAFLQGRTKARQWGLSLVESRALLGLGDIYRQRGQLELAKRMYLEAKACIERPGSAGGIPWLAEADLRLASLTS